ncbi:PDZ domain-containing protein [Metabacillus sp. GX 13764]|uniref:SepM family pheromone-processing serine protease n=1 Tax=Metabacillus kandeliae TaxID=2900151 RepID=UPI001E314E6A|nr:SepM family pheromone-processing serine protease [Metabacillus kandeliae]MCD7033912.1 PDZ domain-containing protein [Metabacillus kandeliae]
MNKRKKTIQAFVAGILLAMILSYAKLPYYIAKPGHADALHSLIRVDSGTESKGSFALTTVSFGKASLLTFAAAHFQPNEQIFSEGEVKSRGESDRDFAKRQLIMMKESQDSAILTAFKEAGKPAEVFFRGLRVSSVEKKADGKGAFQKGDLIYQADGISFKSVEEWKHFLSSKKPGQSIKFSLERNGERKTLTVPVPAKSGIAELGIRAAESRTVAARPAVAFETGGIGGPSAGLMMSLEIYDQLKKEDLTKGYKIAGTGTISSDGRVGPIGGIAQKVIAADREGTAIFFAPAENNNYEDAKKTVQSIHSTIKLVPVRTFKDAVRYLESLPEKKDKQAI